jgi:plasmid stabilization system protein ParE
VRFTVVWLPPAESELMLIWTSSANRGEVTRAADRIDRLLAQNPSQEGESREQDLRVSFQTPLGVLFRVRPDDCIVEVIHVWSFVDI